MRHGILFTTLALAAAATAHCAPDIDSLVTEHAPAAIALRERIHANPELSNREFETADLIATRLGQLGLDVSTGVAHTGVVAILRGGRPGPVVAVRADIDALPVTEDSGLPFASTKTAVYQGREVGLAHACGHDVHMAVQLGLASMLADMRDQLAGTVKFIFQPAEEGPPPGEEGGARMMIAEGVLADPAPEAIFGLHAYPTMTVGQVGHTAGPAWAAADRFRVVIRGRQSHGAAPHTGVDPVVLAAQVVLAFQTIPSRHADPLQPVVLSVGTINGGQRFNIIPGEVEMQGTVRTFDLATQDMVQERMEAILDGLASATGGGYTLDYERVTPFLNNDAALSQWSREVLIGALGADGVVEQPPIMPAEDFALYANAIPGYFFRLGVVEPGGDSGGLHTPDFRAHNDAVAVGMRAMASLVLGYLER